MKIAIITVSDSCAADPSKDVSGPLLKQLFQSSERYSSAYLECKVVADDENSIVQMLITFSDKFDAVITVGGTGLGRRDVTPEATLKAIEKRCGGFEVALHKRSLQSTEMAALSRLVVGVRGKAIIINLPGSPKAVRECFDVLQGVLKHAICLLNDGTDEVHKEHCSMNPRSS